MSLSKNKFVQYNSLDDIYAELIRLYDKAIVKGFDLGEALFKQALHFTDLAHLLRTEEQDFIKRFQFCKTFNCSPFKSYEDTPEDLIDAFMIIKQEVDLFNKSEQVKQKEVNNG